MGSMNGTGLPEGLSYRKVDRGLRWVEICETDGVKFEVALRWISNQRHQEIMAPGAMVVAGVGRREPTAVEQYKTLTECQRDLLREVVVDWRGFSIKNHDATVNMDDPLGPSEDADPDVHKRNVEAYERMKRENTPLPFSDELLNVVIENAPPDNFQTIIVAARDTWAEETKRVEDSGKGDSPSSSAP